MELNADMSGNAQRAALAYLEDAVNALEEGFILWDSDLKFVLCNEKYKELALPSGHKGPKPGQDAIEFGYEIFETGFWKIPTGMDRFSFADHIGQLIRSYVQDLEIVRADGRVISASSNKTSLGGYVLTFIDITDRKRAEAAEAREIEVIKDAVEAISEGFALWSTDQKFVLCNEKYMEALFPPGFQEIKPGEDAWDVTRAFVASGRLVLPDDTNIDDMTRDILDWATSYGERREFELSDGRTVLIRSNRTELGGYLITVRDITNEINSEEKARDMLFDAFQSLDEGMVLLDGEMRFLFGNKAWHRMMFDRPDRVPPKRGESALENLTALVKTGFYDIPDGTSDEEYIAWIMGEMAQHGKQVPYRSADGRHFIGSSHLTAFGGSLLFVRDVTETRRAQEKRLEAVTDAIQATDDALVLFDRDSKFVLANDAWLRGFFSDRVPPEPGADGASMFRALIDDDFYVVPEGHTKESFFDLNMSAFYGFQKNVQLTTSDGRIIVGSSHQTGLGGYLLSFRDMTKLRRAEEKLLDSVIDALQSLTDGIALFDSNFEYIVGNRRYLEMWYPGDIGDPQPGERIEDMARRVVSAGHLLVPDGVSVDQMCEGLVLQAREFAKNLPLETRDGHFLASAHPTSLGGYLLEFTDITDRLRAEAALVREKETSHRNEKLSALGELLAGVAHELNNPLSVIFGYAQMLEGKIEDPKLAQRLSLIQQSAERAAKIVKTFLAMARQRPTKIELCSLNEIVQTAIEVSSYSLTANGTRVVIDLDETIPPVAGDFDQLVQVFTNLIVNAGHALEPKRDAGKLTLRSFYDEAKDDVVVQVKDNGPGIPKELQSRVFEPFFTTKEVGEGTGVGLAFSHRIIQSHGGQLELRSKQKQGTRFYIKLRAANQDLFEKDTSEADLSQWEAKSVLVVDDEAGVAQLTHDLLVEAGFSVTQSVRPRDALEIIKNQNFDVVLSDFKMPDMDGEHFYNAMKAVAPECAERTGFITGDAMSANVKTFLDKSGRPHIEKPIIRQELLALVTQLCRPSIER
ncbi:MAG: PAS-domain containing protein [Pseudomonadota bacterium]